MRKLLIVLLLFFSVSEMSYSQTEPKPRRFFPFVGAPTNGVRVSNFTNGRAGDLWRDYNTGKMYWANGSWVWTEDPNWGNGGGGGSIVATVTTTLPAGSNATSSISGDTLYLGLPRGATGATGSSGSGSSWLDNVFTSPDKYGAEHDSLTFAQHGYNQTSVDSGWPGIGATTTWTVDRASWQMAINEATDERKPIIAYGDYYDNGEITVEKYFASLTIYGGGCYIHATGTSSFAIMKRVDPTDNGDANVMINASPIIKDMSFGGNGSSKQTGLNLGPTYMARYDNTHYFGLDTAIMQRFQLGTMITNTEVNNAGNPYGRVGIWTGIGNWSGASGSNSQSNSTVITGSRFYMVNNTATALKIHSCSGVDVSNIIIEGSDCANGIDFDGNNSTVVKDFKVKNLHFEVTNGAQTAAIKVRMAGGNATVDGAFGQYASVLFDGGYGNFKISNVPYWVPKAGKYFNNATPAGSNSWDLDWNDNMFDAVGTIPLRFSGTAVTIAPVGTMGNGTNKVNVANLIPR